MGIWGRRLYGGGEMQKGGGNKGGGGGGWINVGGEDWNSMVDIKKIHQKPYVHQYTSVSRRDLKYQYISAAHCCFNSFQKRTLCF